MRALSLLSSTALKLQPHSHLKSAKKQKIIRNEVFVIKLPDILLQGNIDLMNKPEAKKYFCAALDIHKIIKTRIRKGNLFLLPQYILIGAKPN